MSFRSQVSDVAKLAATVGVDAVIHEIPPPWDGSLFGPVINEVLAAVLSAIIVIALTNGLFKRPVLSLAWQYNNAPHRTEEISFAPNPGDGTCNLHVSGTLEGQSVLSQWMRRRGYYDHLALQVGTSPGDAIILTADRREHARAGAVIGGLVRMGLQELSQGAPAWVSFTIELNVVPAGSPVTVTLSYELQRHPRPLTWLDRHLLRLDTGVRTIQAIRS